MTETQFANLTVKIWRAKQRLDAKAAAMKKRGMNPAAIAQVIFCKADKHALDAYLKAWKKLRALCNKLTDRAA